MEALLAYIDWNVGPEIFEIGPLKLRWYGILFALSFILGYQLMLKVFKREDLPEKMLESLTIYMILGTVIGARLGHCLFYDPGYYLSNPVEILKIWNGGLASHGAALGILISLFMYKSKYKEIKYSWILDRIVIVVALAGFFIRLGNFFNSEIIGIPTDVPWAVVFERIDNIPRHPSQLYESLSYLLIFVYLWRHYQKAGPKIKEFALFGRFLVLTFTARFIIEFTKEVQVGFENELFLNMGQLLSIPFIFIGLYLLFLYRRKEGIN